MFKLQNIVGLFSLIGLCSTALAAECTLSNSDKTIYLDKAPGIITYNFYNCNKRIKSSEYQWLNTNGRHIIFKSSDYPQDPIYVLHTNQNFTIMKGWGSSQEVWNTPSTLEYRSNYANNTDVRQVDYTIMMGKHLLYPLANFRPGNYETSVKLSVNY